MAQYIDKAVVVAEIESLWKHYLDSQEFDFGWNQALDKVISYLNTLEGKEVDLEKELEDWLGERVGKWTGKECERMCRYFFELGLKVQKGE